MRDPYDDPEVRRIRREAAATPRESRPGVLSLSVLAEAAGGGVAVSEGHWLFVPVFALAALGSLFELERWHRRRGAARAADRPQPYRSPL